MPVNQAQVDSIISSASAEDPEIQLLKLRDEVELLKTSIKRLLIDIRERMNDAENPLVQALKGNPVEFVGQHSSVPTPMEGYIDDYDDEPSGEMYSNEEGSISMSGESGAIEPGGQPDLGMPQVWVGVQPMSRQHYLLLQQKKGCSKLLETSCLLSLPWLLNQ